MWELSDLLRRDACLRSSARHRIGTRNKRLFAAVGMDQISTVFIAVSALEKRLRDSWLAGFLTRFLVRLQVIAAAHRTVFWIGGLHGISFARDGAVRGALTSGLKTA